MQIVLREKTMLSRRSWSLFGAIALSACVEAPQQAVYVTPQPAQRTVVTRPACNTDFRVVNQSGRTVERLYFSHSSLGSWGNDQLGQSVLPPGRQVSYRAANEGAYDFRVIWNNGQEAELRRINVCAASQITITSRGLVAS
jgi:hypothetical protein